MKASKALKALEWCVTHQHPVFLWGMPGIGKSDLVRQVAKAHNLEIVDKRLAQCDPTELKGYPVPDMVKKVMRFLRDETLPTKGKGILFLDELPHASQAVQAVAFQLALDRRIGTYELPPGWSVVAAGNRTTDRSGANVVNAALANRFRHIDLEVDHEDFVDWGLKNNVSDLMRGFIRYRPKSLCVDKIEPGARAFNTPRSIAAADKIMSDATLDDDIKMALVGGTVGEGVAAEIMGYFKSHKSLVNLDRVMVDPDGAPLPDGVSATYAVISALESRTECGNIDRLMKYIKRMPREFQTVYIEAITKKDADLTETRAYNNWIRENRAMLS